MLIHDVMLHKVADKDRWGNAQLDEGMELKRVRLEPSKSIIRDKNNAEIQLSAVMFVDCRNSLPRNVVPELDDIIIFHGQRHQVKLVEPLYDEKRLHHYELGLIAHA